MSHTSLQFAPALLIPEHLIGEVQSKLAYVDENIGKARVSSEGDKIYLLLRESVSDDEAARIEAKVQRVIASMVPGSVRLKVQVLEDFWDRPIPYCENPMDELIRRGELNREAEGIYAMGPFLTRLMEWFEGRFLHLADSFQASSYRFPTLIPAKYLERVDYFRAFPHSLSFVTHLRADLDHIDTFAETAACDEDERLNTTLEHFAPVKALLSPAVCYHLYFMLADKPLPSDGMVATAVGNCFRYESLNLSSLERLWNFTMREMIFVGSKEFVLANRETARQRMQAVFEELGFAYRVESANDPFFIGEFRKQVAFQTAFQLKYEIRARLPFEGSLAVGSYNYHQDFFGRHLNISLPDGSPVHTGCVAFGLERMVFAFLAQFGFDSARWPKCVREALL